MFDKILNNLSDPIRTIFFNIPFDLKNKAQEIRIRVLKPLMINTSDGSYFISKDSEISSIPNDSSYIVRDIDIHNCFRVICGYSIHSYQDDIKNGFITISGGHRVGFCGTAVKENGKITTVKNINSINIRIARQKNGVADQLVTKLFMDKICGILIVGPPSSGKTTLLKDIARILSSGFKDRYIKISVIDERGEIAAISKGLPGNDLGLSCDIFDFYSKLEGMNISIRTMSPDLIICDEIGTREDSLGIEQSLNSGVSVIATAHATSLEELLKRKHIKNLIMTGAFEHIVILNDRKNPCIVKEFIKVSDIFENTRGCFNNSVIISDRNN